MNIDAEKLAREMYAALAERFPELADDMCVRVEAACVADTYSVRPSAGVTVYHDRLDGGDGCDWVEFDLRTDPDEAARLVGERLAAVAEMEANELDVSVEELKAAIERGGFGVSPCMSCGEAVVCIHDGMPMCESCATNEGN